MGPDLVSAEGSCVSPPRIRHKPCLVGAALRNLGNTCFLNAILQCLTHTVPLVEKIREIDHSSPCCDDDDGFCSFCALKKHINRCLSSSGLILSPTAFAENLSKISSHFQLGQQEDAHEFLQSLLDNIHTYSVGRIVRDGSSFLDKDSLIKQIFGGSLRSQLRCCNCGYRSNTFEPVFDLSLEIDNVDSILDALASFTKFEKIDDPQVKFTCEGCKKQVQMEKQLKLDQAPVVLALHLKRFKNSGGISYKITNPVEYPLELDLNSCLSRETDQVPLKYDLYAVLVHVGTSNFGHYFCYIRTCLSIWHLLDDSKVTRVSESCALGQEAYVLFYVKKGSSRWFSNLMEEEKTFNLERATDTSPSSVLDHAERHHLLPIGYEDNCSCSREAGRDDAHCKGSVSSTIDASVDPREQNNMPTPSLSFDQNARVKILPYRIIHSTREGNEKRAEEAASDQPSSQSKKQRISVQNLDYVFEDEILDCADDDDNHLVPQLQVKLNPISKSKKIAPEPLKDAQMNDAFNRLVRGMPSSRRSGILACIASQQTNLRKSQPISIQSSVSKKCKVGASVHFNRDQRSTEASGQSLSPHSIRQGLFVNGLDF